MPPSSSSTMPTWMRRSRAPSASKYRNTGQTCVCANRLLVQDGVYDAFAAKLAAAVAALKVGDGMEPGVSQGPLIDMKGRRQSRRAYHGCARQGRARRRRAAIAMRLAAPFSSRPYSATSSQPVARPRGNVRPGGAVVPVQDRGGGDPARQRHRVRPGRPISMAAISGEFGASPRRLSTASSGSTRA